MASPSFFLGQENLDHGFQELLFLITKIEEKLGAETYRKILFLDYYFRHSQVGSELLTKIIAQVIFLSIFFFAFVKFFFHDAIFYFWKLDWLKRMGDLHSGKSNE